MAIRNDFTAGEVLAAADLNDTFAAKADYNLPVDAESGTTYTFTLANARQLVTATNASAKTFTIPPQSSVTWTAQSIIRVVNYGAGAMTINGGVGVTVTNTASTLAQFQSAAAFRTAENAWTLVPFAGGAVSNANFSDASTGTYTDSGISYKYITYTGSGTLTVTAAGVADVLVIAGGGGGGNNVAGGGGAGGYLYSAGVFLPAETLTVVVGGGGAGGASINALGANGTNSGVDYYMALGGGGSKTSGGSGGGAHSFDTARGLGFIKQGNQGGGAISSLTSGSGGGGVGGVGGDATNSPVAAGAGGAGLSNAITGTSVGRGGGGAGGINSSPKALGTSGGGNGGESGTNPTAGSANTGGGGGGGQGSANGGNGGSGVVIIAVRTN